MLLLLQSAASLTLALLLHWMFRKEETSSFALRLDPETQIRCWAVAQKLAPSPSCLASLDVARRSFVIHLPSHVRYIYAAIERRGEEKALLTQKHTHTHSFQQNKVVQRANVSTLTQRALFDPTEYYLLQPGTSSKNHSIHNILALLITLF